LGVGAGERYKTLVRNGLRPIIGGGVTPRDGFTKGGETLKRGKMERALPW